MCLPKAPKIDMPKPVAPPPAQQEAKAPDSMANTRRKQGQDGIAGGTLLTGSMTGGAGTSTGATSLLGM